MTRELTTAEYAERANVRPDFVRHLIRTGHLRARVLKPTAKRPTYRIKESDIRLYEKECR